MKNRQSKINDLIKKHCPDGVEYRELGKVAEIKRGKRLVKGQLEETGDYAVYQNSMSPLGYFHESNVKSDTTFIISAGSAGEIGYSDVSFWAADDVYFFLTPDDIINKFLYYCLLKQQHKILSQVRRASIPRLSKISVEILSIPLPPLPVQEEIVRILDAFTSLTAELSAELSARKKQYHYYRDRLLSFDESRGKCRKIDDLIKKHCPVQWRALGEVAGYSDRRIDATSLSNDNYVGVDNLLQNRAGKVKSNHTPETGSAISYEEDDVLIGNIRPYLKKIWHSDQKGGANGDILVIRIKSEERKHIVPRYLYQVLADDSFFYYATKTSKGAKMPRGNKQIIMKYKIPLPPLSVQEEIVAILDKFDALTHSLQEGLPREIELRQKQYEYYRDQLLNFPNPEEAAA